MSRARVRSDRAFEQWRDVRIVDRTVPRGGSLRPILERKKSFIVVEEPLIVMKIVLRSVADWQGDVFDCGDGHTNPRFWCRYLLVLNERLEGG